MWFESLTGFREESADQVRSNIVVNGETMTSTVNGRTMLCGHLETPTLAELRSRTREVDAPKGTLTLREIVTNQHPAHTRKGNRRYRYYVSRAVLQFREQASGSVIRVPAQTIEDRVTGQTKMLLSNARELLRVLRPYDLSATAQKDVIARGNKMATDWDGLPFDQQIGLIKRLIGKVVVSRTQIIMMISSAHLAEELLGADVTTKATKAKSRALENHVICLPVHLKRCGIETKLVIPSEDQTSILPHYITIHAIRQALIKALTWNQALIDGSATSMTDLAKRNNVTQRYIAHLIKLAFLAPDIIEAILRGEVPLNLSLDRLKAGFPLDWEEQRQALGFFSSSAKPN